MSLNKVRSLIILGLVLFGLSLFNIKNTNAVKPQDYNLKEGDLISAVFSDDPDVYIINDYGYKRLFLNPEIFKFYSHLGGFASVKIVTPEIRDAFVTSGLFRDCENNDQKVYGIQTTGEDNATLNWVDTSGTQAVTDDPDFFKKVFCINNKEFSWYPRGSEFHSVREVPSYSRRKDTPTPTPVFTSTPTPSPTPTPSATPVPTLSITISNTTDWLRNPTFLAGDYYRIVATTNTSNKILKSCYTFNGSSGCDIGNYSTNFYGTLSLDSQVLGISVGTWSRWVEIDGIKSNIVSYSVVEAPQLYIYNLTEPSRNPAFLAGDGLRLAVSSSANKSLKLCYTFNGNSDCDVTGSTNYQGTYNLDTQVLGISAGSWSRWAEIDGIKSNIVNYTVSQ